MLKTGCIFDLDQIEKFYQDCGENAGITNDSMFFQMSEDGEFFGMIRMHRQGEACFLDDIVAKSANIQYEEFLLKSCVNFALTFSATEIKTSKKYQQFLIPMFFSEVGDLLVGKTDEIDFPHACNHGK